jgi:hypothetical protein
MTITVLFVLALLAVLAVIISAKRAEGLTVAPGSRVPRRKLIRFGTSDLKSRPYYVQLYRGDTKYCGGVLIAPGVVLTAAHCLTGNTVNDLICRVGDDNINTQPIKGIATRIVIHERFLSNRDKSLYKFLRITLNAKAAHAIATESTCKRGLQYNIDPIENDGKKNFFKMEDYELVNDIYSYGVSDIAVIFFDVKENNMLFPIEMSTMPLNTIKSTFSRGGLEVIGRGLTEKGKSSVDLRYFPAKLNETQYDFDAHLRLGAMSIMSSLPAKTNRGWCLPGRRCSPSTGPANTDRGDSGSPMVYIDPVDQQPRLIGIQSTAASDRTYGRATIVQNYANWINKAIDMHSLEKSAAGTNVRYKTRPSLAFLDVKITQREISHVLHALCAEEMRALRQKTNTSSANPSAQREKLSFRELWGEDMVDLEKYFGESKDAYENLLNKCTENGVLPSIAEAHIQQAIVWQLVTGEHTEEILLEMVTADIEEDSVPNEGVSLNKFKSVAYLKSATELRNQAGTRKFKIAYIGGSDAWPGGQPRKVAKDKTVITCDRVHLPGEPPYRHGLDDPGFVPVCFSAAAGWTCQNILQPYMLRHMFCDFVRKFQAYMSMRQMRPWYPQYLAFAATQPTRRTEGMLEAIYSPPLPSYGLPGLRLSTYDQNGTVVNDEGLDVLRETRAWWKSNLGDGDGSVRYRWLQEDGTPWPALGEKTMYEEYAWINQYEGGAVPFSEALFMCNNDEQVFNPAENKWIGYRDVFNATVNRYVTGNRKIAIDGVEQDRLRQTMIHEDFTKPVYAIGDRVFVRHQDGNRLSERFFSGTVRRYRVIEKNERDVVAKHKGFKIPLKIRHVEAVFGQTAEMSSELWHWGEYYVEYDDTTLPPADRVNRACADAEEKGRYAMGQNLWPRGEGKVNALRTRALYECTNPAKKPAPALPGGKIKEKIKERCPISPTDKGVIAAAANAMQGLASLVPLEVKVTRAANSRTPPSRPRWRAIVAEAISAMSIEQKAFDAYKAALAFGVSGFLINNNNKKKKP